MRWSCFWLWSSGTPGKVRNDVDEMGCENKSELAYIRKWSSLSSYQTVLTATLKSIFLKKGNFSFKTKYLPFGSDVIEEIDSLLPL